MYLKGQIGCEFGNKSWIYFIKVIECLVSLIKAVYRGRVEWRYFCFRHLLFVFVLFAFPCFFSFVSGSCSGSGSGSCSRSLTHTHTFYKNKLCWTYVCRVVFLRHSITKNFLSPWGWPREGNSSPTSLDSTSNCGLHGCCQIFSCLFKSNYYRCRQAPK